MVASDTSTTVQQSAGYLFDFVPPRAFDFDQENTGNVAQVIIYCHVTISSLLELIDHVLSISENVSEKQLLSTYKC